jgi:hypothetical protein
MLLNRTLLLKRGKPTGLDAAKEVLVGALRAAADRLQHAEVDGRHVGAIATDRLKLVGLIVVVRRHARHAVGLTSFQQAGVVDLTRNVKLLLQERSLLVRGVQAVQVRLLHRLDALLRFNVLNVLADRLAAHASVLPV